MSVIPITLFFSLLLAGTFVVLFAREHRRRRFASAERDSLLPLADERPQVAAADDDHDDEHHAHAGGAGPVGHGLGDSRCGCRDGHRPPCVGCRRRREKPASLSP